MSGLEVLPIRSEIYIPENKVSAWVSKNGKNVARDRSKEFQGEWVVDEYTLDKRKQSIEVWIFYDDDELGIDRRVLENNPLQGSWGYAPGVDPRHAEIKDMWFFPPKSARCKIPSNKEEYNHKGTWIKPVFKRDFSQLGTNSSGFMNVSGNMRIAKGEKHSVAGKWNMLGFNDDIVRGKKKPKKDDDSDAKGPWKIYVRKPNGSRFSISVIPGNRISDCKKKIFAAKAIPIEDQRLSFNQVLLKDAKTVVGSGIRNGDTIDLEPMVIYVRTRKGKKYSFEVDPEELIESVKTKVEKHEGTPADEQRLYFKNRKLRDGKTLSDFNIQHKSTLDLGPMIIYVKPHGDDPKLPLDVEPTDTLKSVKLQVKNRLQIPVSDQRLSFEETEMLSNSKDLQSYNVKHLDTLYMMDGGATDKKSNDNNSNMIIFVVKEWNNHKFKLRTEPTNTILDVKKMIEASENIPVDQQRLTFKKKSVYNTKTLEQSKVKHRSILHLGEPRDTNTKRPKGRKVSPISPGSDPSEEKPKHPEAVEVLLPDKSKITIPVTPSTTFADIKDHIETTNDIPRKKQRIFFFDEENEPDDSTPLSKADLSGSLPVLTLHQDPETVEVKTPDGRSFFFDFDPDSDTMEDLKNKISTSVGLPVKDLHLYDNDDETIDENTDKMPSILNVAPEIDVVLPDKSKVKLQMLPKMTIEDLKDVIEEKTGTPKADQRIFFFDSEGNELDDTVPMKKAGIKPDSVLEMRPSLHEDPEPIEVKTPDGRSFFFDFDPDSDTMEDLKNKIATSIGLPVKDLHLYDNDDEIIDENTDNMPSRGDILNVAPEIDVVLPDKSKVKLQMLPKMTIEDLKDVIEEKTGTPKADQRIFFFDSEGNELDDTVPLGKAGINPGSVLEMRPSAPEEDKIMLRLPGRRTFFFDFDPDSDTRDDVMNKISREFGVPVRNLPPLMLNDEELDDNYLPSKGDILDFVPTETEVELPDRSRIVLATLPMQTFGELKEIVEEKTGFKHSDQRIFFFDEAKEVDDDVMLTKAKIQTGTPLKIFSAKERKEPKEIQIKDPSGRIFKLIIDPDEPVHQVKDRIREKIGIPIGGFKLDDKVWDDIDDDIPLDDAGIPVRSGGILEIDPPEIEVALPNSEKIKLKILPTMTIGDVKKMIEIKAPELSSVKTNQRVFFFDDNQELEDDTPFEKLKFEHGQTLEMRSMMINVEHRDGRNFELNVQTDWYVDDIRDQIHQRANIPPEQQNFSFNGEPVKEELTLIKQDIVHGSTLILQPMVIFVNIPSRKKPLRLVVELTDTVDEIKRKALKKIKKEKSRSSRNYCLVSGGQELCNNETLEKCDVQNEDVLTLEEFKLRIMHWSGEVIDLDGAKRNATIASIKKQIHKVKGIPIDDQRLSLDGRHLNDKNTLEEEKVKHRTMLVLEPLDADIETIKADKRNLKMSKIKKFKSNEGDEIMPVMPDWERRIFFFDFDTNFDARIELVIMHWTGEKFMLDNMLLSQKVSKIKSKIYKLKGIKKKKQIIRFDGKILGDKKTLLEQNIGHRSILVLESPDKNTIAAPSVERLNGIFSTVPTKMVTSINVKVRHWDGDTFDLSVAPYDYIDDVKDLIYDLKRIPLEQIHISFDGQPTQEDMNLKEHGISDGSTLVLEPMRIFLQLPTKKKPISLNVDMNLKIHDIKKSVAKKTKLPFESLCIMFGGEELDNSKTLLDCGVEHEDQIRVETFEIKIMHWLGEIFSIHNVSPSETIYDLKERISELSSISIQEQTLIFKGQVLNDVIRLKDHNVHHKAILMLDPPDEKSRSPVKAKVSFTLFNNSKLEGGTEDNIRDLPIKI